MKILQLNEINIFLAALKERKKEKKCQAKVLANLISTTHLAVLCDASITLTLTLTMTRIQSHSVALVLDWELSKVI